MCESGGGGRRSDRRGGFDGEAGSGRWERQGKISSDEHVVGLDGGADEEAGEGDGGEAEATGEVLVHEGLFWRGGRELVCEAWKRRKGIRKKAKGAEAKGAEAKKDKKRTLE